MKMALKRFYFFVYVPVKSMLFMLGTLLSIGFVLLTFIYAVSFELVLDNKIFKASRSDIMKIMTWKPDDNSIILDKTGKVISEQFNEYHVYLPYEKIPKKIIDAIISIEDRKFWEHKGIDIYSIVRAAKGYINPSHKGLRQGASTITQQLVKNLVLSNEKTITRKVREIVLSLYLETTVTKEKIIEIYCNTMFLGSGSYGIGAAAKRFFNKQVEELDHHETALIAGLFQSPGKYNPMKHPERAKKRQKVVLASMLASRVLSQTQFENFINKELVYEKYESSYGKNAPYFVDHVIEESNKILSELNLDLKDSGVKIYTTLDSNLNSLARESINESKSIFSNLEKNIIFDNKKENSIARDVEGALLVLDRRNGKILTMVGGRDYSHSQFNRTTKALRAPGSTFKSITYALSLKKGNSWNKQYYVSPITIGNYRPRTQHSKLFTETTLLQSFYKSINSTAVLVGSNIGVKRVIDFGEKLGIETPLKNEAATLLGSSEVTMLDMARVYSTFSNDGVLNKVSAIEKIVDRDGKILYSANDNLKDSKKRILSRRTNQLVVEGLKSVIRYGTGYKARHLGGRVAGKTGTSNKSKDNWFCGFTDDLVVVVWVGNDDQNSFSGSISASNTATPIWANFVRKSINHLNTRRLRRPSKLRLAKVHPEFGHRDRNGVGMYFVAGTAPTKKKSDLLLLREGTQLRVGMNDM